MKLGMVGLGKMGGNMVKRLVAGGHEVVATDLSPEAREQSRRDGATPAGDLRELIDMLPTPRTVWLMVPSGMPTEASIRTALEYLEAGDVLVDGANSHWPDSIRRAGMAKQAGVQFVDAGVSGGVWGLEEGYNLMIGGPEGAFSQVEPALKTLAPPGGYAHVGPSGSGHFVKMIHNGIEYALMEAYGEGFEAMASFPHAELDLQKIAGLWQQGAVIRSWLLGLLEDALEHDRRLEHIEGYVNDTGMGRWTVQFGV
ncbi:MAG TPA: NADP-dependent phosphogluconate dehydrogenase, partial [Trueperaceae bacterium]